MFEEEIKFRSILCQNCTCGVDKKDPCAFCPLKKWKTFLPLCDKSQETPKEQMPKLNQMIQNLGKAITQESLAILKSKPNITEKEKNNRLDICRSCEFFVSSSQRCMKCGCFMPIKTGWRSQKCPIGKWGPSV